MKSNQKIMRFLYIGFTALGIYQAFGGEFSQAAMSLGVALAFDPFNPNQTWKERPLWQKATLLIHLALCAAFFGYEIGFADRG
jgi:hypothetical protein